ncbi:MAG TPA: cytochrome c3 family protein [Candidatus Deferrimicrobiaceae bacterium]
MTGRRRAGRYAGAVLLAALASASMAWAPVPAAGQEPVDQCFSCHNRLGGTLGAPAKEHLQSVHREAGVTCVTCHGGNSSMPGEEGMDPRYGFRKKPTHREIPRFCAGCHSDIARMRQYNLSTDQFAEYQTSVHGKLLYGKNDSGTAVCTSCHGTHDIRRKSDPESTVFLGNVPATCGKCHSDPDRMKPYGIPVDQVEDYRKGVHGRILAGKIPGKNPSIAPNCATCHGVHGATPPGVKEIANVCGNCHGVVAGYFREGPHFRAVQETGEPRCIHCHGNHSNRNPSLRILEGTAPGDCGSCHEKGGPAMEFAGNVRDLMNALEGSMEEIRQELETAAASGRNVDRLKREVDSARTRMIEIEPVFHTVSLDRILPLIHQADSYLRDARTEIEIMREEARQRRSVAFYGAGMLLLIALLLGIRLALLPDTRPPAGGEKTG